MFALVMLCARDDKKRAKQQGSRAVTQQSRSSSQAEEAAETDRRSSRAAEQHRQQGLDHVVSEALWAVSKALLVVSEPPSLSLIKLDETRYGGHFIIITSI